MNSRDVEGNPHINTADGGLVLTVYPPEGSGKRCTFEAVRAEIERLNVKSVNWEDVKHVVDNALGHPVVLIPPKAKNGDSQIFVEISDDEMSARVTVLPPDPGGQPGTLDRVRAPLATQGGVFGVREDLLNALAGPMAALADTAAKHAPVESLIAEGLPVVHGQDAYMDKYWEKKEKEAAAETQAGLENKNTRVDYRNLTVIDNVEKDSVLCRLVPAKQGRAGKTVTGKTIEPNGGADMTLVPGTGVILDPKDPTLFIPTETGHVVLKDGTISALPLFEVNGDLTLKIGNIDFSGTVLIHGSITGEYKVKAGQDVVIDGVLDGGEVSAGGKVLIKGGIIGQKTRVTADGNVEAKYIRNA